MEVTIKTEPENSEEIVDYKFFNSVPLKVAKSKLGLISFETIGYYGLNLLEIEEHGFIWQCPYELFNDEERFLNKLREEFDKPYLEIKPQENNEKYKDYKLLRLSTMPIRNLTHPDSYNQFKMAFLSLGKEPEDYHYYRKCSGKFYFNLTDSEIEQDKKYCKLKGELANLIFNNSLIEKVENLLINKDNYKREDEFSIILNMSETIKFNIDTLVKINNFDFNNPIKEYLLQYTQNFLDGGKDMGFKYFNTRVKKLRDEVNYHLVKKDDEINEDLLKDMFKLVSYKFKDNYEIVKNFIGNKTKMDSIKECKIYDEIIKNNRWYGYLILLDMIHRRVNKEKINYASYEKLYGKINPEYMGENIYLFVNFNDLAKLFTTYGKGTGPISKEVPKEFPNSISIYSLLNLMCDMLVRYETNSISKVITKKFHQKYELNYTRYCLSYVQIWIWVFSEMDTEEGFNVENIIKIITIVLKNVTQNILIDDGIKENDISLANITGYVDWKIFNPHIDNYREMFSLNKEEPDKLYEYIVEDIKEIEDKGILDFITQNNNKYANILGVDNLDMLREFCGNNLD